MMDFVLTGIQIRLMKHAIGFEKGRVTGLKHRKYQAYRNYFTTSDYDVDWDNLVDQELAWKQSLERGCGENPQAYGLTKDGLEVLGEITGVAITEMD